jgi:hypothetical protein
VCARIILTCRTSINNQQTQGIISFNDAFSPKALQVRPINICLYSLSTRAEHNSLTTPFLWCEQTFCEAFDLNVPEVIQVNGVDSNVPGTSGRVLAYGAANLSWPHTAHGKKALKQLSSL